MDIKFFSSSIVAMLAHINHMHKIKVITSLQKHFSDIELRYITSKSSFKAMIIPFFCCFLES